MKVFCMSCLKWVDFIKVEILVGMHGRVRAVCPVCGKVNKLLAEEWKG